MESIKEFRGNELAQASAVKEDLTCSSSSPLNKSDQAISQANSTRGLSDVRSGPGLKLRHGGLTPEASGSKPQAPSFKLQASIDTSYKRQAPSNKLLGT